MLDSRNPLAGRLQQKKDGAKNLPRLLDRAVSRLFLDRADDPRSGRPNTQNALCLSARHPENRRCRSVGCQTIIGCDREAMHRTLSRFSSLRIHQMMILSAVVAEKSHVVT